MAAKPIERHVKRQIMEQGGWDRILERIASAETIADIARTLYRPDGPAIDRSTLSHMLHNWARSNPANQVVLDAAQRESASARVDKAIHEVESAPLDKDAIQKARVLADVGFRYAGLVDRATWGEARQAVNVQVNVEAMHLGALRHRETETLEQPEVSVQSIAQLPALGACDTEERVA